MKILTKYLLKSLIQPLIYLLFGFMLILIINDLFDNFSDFLESNISFPDILSYYGLRVPEYILGVLPVCLLLAMLYSLSRLTRHSEIVAMRAGASAFTASSAVSIPATSPCIMWNSFSSRPKTADPLNIRPKRLNGWTTAGGSWM